MIIHDEDEVIKPPQDRRVLTTILQDHAIIC